MRRSRLGDLTDIINTVLHHFLDINLPSIETMRLFPSVIANSAREIQVQIYTYSAITCRDLEFVQIAVNICIN